MNLRKPDFSVFASSPNATPLPPRTRSKAPAIQAEVRLFIVFIVSHCHCVERQCGPPSGFAGFGRLAGIFSSCHAPNKPAEGRKIAPRDVRRAEGQVNVVARPE